MLSRFPRDARAPRVGQVGHAAHGGRASYPRRTVVDGTRSIRPRSGRRFVIDHGWRRDRGAVEIGDDGTPVSGLRRRHVVNAGKPSHDGQGRRRRAGRESLGPILSGRARRSVERGGRESDPPGRDRDRDDGGIVGRMRAGSLAAYAVYAPKNVRRRYRVIGQRENRRGSNSPRRLNARREGRKTRVTGDEGRGTRRLSTKLPRELLLICRESV